MNTVTKIALIAGLTTASLGTSYAMDSDDHEASAVVSAKIDMSQAIASAESAAGGKASRAEFEKHHGIYTYDIEVVSAKKTVDVRVDATTGKVISQQDDKAD